MHWPTAFKGGDEWYPLKANKNRSSGPAKTMTKWDTKSGSKLDTRLAKKSDNQSDQEKEIDIVDIDYVDTWTAMEALYDKEKIRAIGVANFSLKKLQRLISKTKVIPAVVQVELHPYLPQVSL